MEQTVIGPYELIDRLGSGGMGIVYRARDTRLQRDVAVKVLSESYIGSGTPGHASHERFLREARAASSLNHPNICTIHDVGEHGGKPYLVMELLQGQTLRAALQGTPLPIDQVIDFGIQLARALEEAHAAGIIHRDIKPANIFIVRKQQGSQQIKVLDFGLAKIARAFSSESAAENTSDSTGLGETAAGLTLTTPGTTIGTLAYMSPEQARGQTLDVRSDLFSLGAVLYEMATGKLPFDGEVSADVLAALLTKEPVPLRKLNPAVPKELERIILKLLSKNKEQRYATAGELRVDLEKMVGRTSSRHTIPIDASAPKSKTPLMIAGAALVVVALSAGGFYLWHGHQPSAPASGAAAVIHERDSVILSDFTNQTGDPVFDTTLTQALEIQLEQSPFLTIVSQQHLRQSLQYLRTNRQMPRSLRRSLARSASAKALRPLLTGPSPGWATNTSLPFRRSPPPTATPSPASRRRPPTRSTSSPPSTRQPPPCARGWANL